MSHPRLRLPRLTASPPQIRKASHGPMGPPTWPIAAHRHSRESAQTRRTPLADLQTHETGHKFAAKAFDCVDHNKLWKIIQEMGIPDHLTCLLRNLYAGQKQQLELDMKKQTGCKLGKVYNKAVYFHPAYLNSV